MCEPETFTYHSPKWFIPILNDVRPGKELKLLTFFLTVKRQNAAVWGITTKESIQLINRIKWGVCEVCPCLLRISCYAQESFRCWPHRLCSEICLPQVYTPCLTWKRNSNALELPQEDTPTLPPKRGRRWEDRSWAWGKTQNSPWNVLNFSQSKRIPTPCSSADGTLAAKAILACSTTRRMETSIVDRNKATSLLQNNAKGTHKVEFLLNRCLKVPNWVLSFYVYIHISICW